MDNCVVKSNNERSIFTIILYLNDDFTGGETVFHNRPTDGTLPYVDQEISRIGETIVPKTGQVLIFNHDVLHEGLEVLQGTKYIIRGEIMFKRVTTSGSILDVQSLQPFLKSSMLFNAADMLEMDGDLSNATLQYLKALSIQVNYSSSVTDYPENHIEMLPNETLMNILR
jgi:hypothetical protein